MSSEILHEDEPLIIDEELRKDSGSEGVALPGVRIPLPKGRRRTHQSFIGVIVALAVLVSLIMIFAIVSSAVSPVVGKWHIQRIEYSGEELHFGYSMDSYLIFYANGTGEGYVFSSLSSAFHWRDMGNSTVKLDFGNSSHIFLHYRVSGNSVTFSYHAGSGTYTLYGIRA